MKKILLSLLLLFLAVSYFIPKDITAGEEIEGLELLLELKDEPIKQGEPIRGELKLSNKSQQKKHLEFNTGQRYDLLLIGTKDEVLYRWAEDKFFTQALGTLTLEPQEKKSYQVEFRLPEDIGPGQYQLMGLITTGDDIHSNLVKLELKK